MLWALMPSGSRNPLNPEPMEPARGIVAFDPRTEKGIALTDKLIADGAPARWAETGVTFHLSHWADCPARAAFRERYGR